jgi:Fic family protein
MNTAGFTNDSGGRLVRTSANAFAFVPSPLPPELPLSWALLDAISRAERAVGNLRGVGRTLPNPHLLIEPFVRREAVLSSRIEGTQASVGDLLLFEIGGRPTSERSDVREVANYVDALEYGFDRLRDLLPLSLRFVREVHERLMRDVRGSTSAPGEFRRVQNWIGPPGSTLETASYVPPPPNEIPSLLDDLEKYLHASSQLPALIRFALIHYQFEAIHPFLDGNGRVGRLLITFLLHVEQMLDQPLLYLSAFFERHRDEYYARLLDVSRRGAWLEWVTFFLRGVEEQANDAVRRANELLALLAAYRHRVATARNSALLGAIVDRLFESPAVTITGVARDLDITHPSAKKNVEKLVALGVLGDPVGPGERKKIYIARDILALLEAD